MEPTTEMLLGLGRTFIPIISSSDSLSVALRKNTPVILAAATHCATVGGAMAAPALYSAIRGRLWGLSAAVGLVSAPAWVPIAGGLAGLITVGSGIKIGLDRLNYAKQFHAIRVGYQVCSLIAAATPDVPFRSELSRILHQYNLTGTDLITIESSVPASIASINLGNLDEDFRRRILEAAAGLGTKAGWPKEVEVQFAQAAQHLGLDGEAAAVRERCELRTRDQQDLIEGMFASCSHLFHQVSLENAEPFLSALGGFHPQAQRLQRSLKIADTVAKLGSLAATAGGQPALGQVIAQTWNGCRGAASSLIDSRMDQGFEHIAKFFTRELGVPASDISRIRGDVDSAVETVLAVKVPA